MRGLPDGRWMSAADASRELGISSRTVIRLLSHQAKKVGREWVIPTPAVRELQKNRLSKKCPWCGSPALIGVNYITCGSPKCTKRQRQQASMNKQKRANDRPLMERIAMSPDGLGRKRIKEAIGVRVDNGMVLTDAVREVAVQECEKPAVVLSVWRSA